MFNPWLSFGLRAWQIGLEQIPLDFRHSLRA